MSLLKGDKLRQNKALVDVVLRKDKDIDIPYFTDIIYGNKETLDTYRKFIGDYLQ